MPLLFVGCPTRVLSDTIIGVLNAYRKRIETTDCIRRSSRILKAKGY